MKFENINKNIYIICIYIFFLDTKIITELLLKKK